MREPFLGKDSPKLWIIGIICLVVGIVIGISLKEPKHDIDLKSLVCQFCDNVNKCPFCWNCIARYDVSKGFYDIQCPVKWKDTTWWESNWESGRKVNWWTYRMYSKQKCSFLWMFVERNCDKNKKVVE